jgi:hypothetical protein
MSLFPEIADYINGLESNVMLFEKENGELTKSIEEFLRESA